MRKTLLPVISVIIPYRDRPQNLHAILRNISRVHNDKIEFHIINLGKHDSKIENVCHEADAQYHSVNYHGIFTIGIALNYGAKIATGDYILKQDVDCLPYLGFYEKLLTYTDSISKNYRAWANIGVYYCNRGFSEKYLEKTISYQTYVLAKNNDNNKEKIKFACGNCFLVNRKHYINLGGISEKFIGWGWEDYYFLYCLEKIYKDDFKLSSYTEKTIVRNCREELARPKNEVTNVLDIVFLHKWHNTSADESNYRLNTQINRKHLLELIYNFDVLKT